ncbi:MAG TPA: tRNA (adenosine(37)-N6)-dimethylallyltransferase MiaA [Eubacteriaceae bacterium]|nr:tRNA (adenosine(37)-N6)-dimethylallyltransferase MiaA [Eubacteriaceae bacterium]
MNKPLIIILGPTAVGKTDIAIQIAKRIGGEIISADSMQVYKYMNIGTAKPDKEEMEGIEHYLIDEIEPDEEFNVAIFQKRAIKYIDKILNKNRIPIVAGGTGLYINSLIYPLDFTDGITNWKYRDQLNEIANDKGNEYLHNLLKEIDPISASNIHPNNRKRVIRALEIYKETGKTMSYYKEISKDKKTPFNPLIIGLKMKRQLLYERINKRVDMMIDGGLVNEVKEILDKGYNKDLISMLGLGYKEIIKYLEGKYTLEEAIYILKRDTRRFAKRQLTWFRRIEDVSWYDIGEYDSKYSLIEDILKEINEFLL